MLFIERGGRRDRGNDDVVYFKYWVWEVFGIVKWSFGISNWIIGLKSL